MHSIGFLEKSTIKIDLSHRTVAPEERLATHRLLYPVQSKIPPQDCRTAGLQNCRTVLTNRTVGDVHQRERQEPTSPPKKSALTSHQPSLILTFDVSILETLAMHLRSLTNRLTSAHEVVYECFMMCQKERGEPISAS